MRALSLSAMQELVRGFRSYLAEARMLSGGTIRRYAAVVEAFAAFLAKERGEEDLALEAVKKDELVRFLRKEAGQSEEPSRAVWNSRLAALRSFYDYLFREEVIIVNPALRIDRQKHNPRERLPLSFDEMVALVEAAREHSPAGARTRNAAIVQIFFHCALRVAEVVSLTLAQVDLVNRVFLNVRTKGNKRLSAPFNDVVAEALERYLPEREKLLEGRSESALFLSTQRRRLSVRAVQNLVGRYAELAGIKRPVSPHVLRHSSATEYADFAQLQVVQEVCGHASITTTRGYVHVKGRERRAAVDEFGARWKRRARSRRGPAPAPEPAPKTA